MDDHITIGRKTSTLKELEEWMSKDEDTKRWMIFIVDDDNAVIKKITSDKVI